MTQPRSWANRRFTPAKKRTARGSPKIRGPVCGALRWRQGPGTVGGRVGGSLGRVDRGWSPTCACDAADSIRRAAPLMKIPAPARSDRGVRRFNVSPSAPARRCSTPRASVRDCVCRSAGKHARVRSSSRGRQSFGRPRSLPGYESGKVLSTPRKYLLDAADAANVYACAVASNLRHLGRPRRGRADACRRRVAATHAALDAHGGEREAALHRRRVRSSMLDQSGERQWRRGAG